MAQIKVENLGAVVNWPAGEKVPASMDEALKRGWTVTNDDISATDGERSMTGVYLMEKTVGRRRLSLEIQYRAEFTFGKPFGAQARKLSYQLFDITPRDLTANGTVAAN